MSLYEGHRQRVQEKFLKYGGDVFADYELLEYILMRSIPRRDVKPLAKQLLNQFGSFSNVLKADIDQLKQVPGIKEGTVAFFKMIVAAGQRLSHEKLSTAPILSDWATLLDYAQMLYVGDSVETLRILFLNPKLQLIHMEIHQTGTVNHVPIYPREILKRALNLNASAVILMHNHPTGDATPSQDDIVATKEIEKLLNTIPIKMIDHLIIGSNRQVYSFRAHRL